MLWLSKLLQLPTYNSRIASVPTILFGRAIQECALTLSPQNCDGMECQRNMWLRYGACMSLVHAFTHWKEYAFPYFIIGVCPCCAMDLHIQVIDWNGTNGVLVCPDGQCETVPANPAQIQSQTKIYLGFSLTGCGYWANGHTTERVASRMRTRNMVFVRD
jgi:hypothetical protein